MAPAEVVQHARIDLTRPHDGHPAPRDRPQRRGPKPALEHRPLAEDGTRAHLGHDLAVDLDRRALRRAGGRSRRPVLPVRPACFPPSAAELRPRARRMIVFDSWRSRADSTAVTRAGVSVSPHGVCTPNAWRYQSLKSARPALASRWPSGAEHPVAGERAGAGQLDVDGPIHVIVRPASSTPAAPGTGRTAACSPAGEPAEPFVHRRSGRIAPSRRPGPARPGGREAPPPGT